MFHRYDIHNNCATEIKNKRDTDTIPPLEIEINIYFMMKILGLLFVWNRSKWIFITYKHNVFLCQYDTHIGHIYSTRNSNPIFYLSYLIRYCDMYICSIKIIKVIFASRKSRYFYLGRAEISIVPDHTFITCVEMCRAHLYIHFCIHIITYTILHNTVWHVQYSVSVARHPCMQQRIDPACPRVTTRVCVTRERIRTYYPILDFIRLSASHVRVHASLIVSMIIRYFILKVKVEKIFFNTQTYLVFTTYVNGILSYSLFNW